MVHLINSNKYRLNLFLQKTRKLQTWLGLFELVSNFFYIGIYIPIYLRNAIGR